jgi:hypothetical protein
LRQKDITRRKTGFIYKGLHLADTVENPTWRMTAFRAEAEHHTVQLRTAAPGQ